MAEDAIDKDTVIAERSGREIILSSKAFVGETRWLSWFHLLSLCVSLPLSLALAVMDVPLPLRWAASAIAGLLIVRFFIVYHDFKHGSILAKSRPATAIMDLFGLLCLTPSNVWTETHNYHHNHTAKLVGSNIGSYQTANLAMWERMSKGQRLAYRITRHPLTILFGYFTIFIYGMCVTALIRNPKKNLDSLLALALQAAIVAGLWLGFGFETLWFGFLFPQMLSHAAGAYLFYAQHNFPEMHIQPREDWTYVRAALESSSYLQMGPLMHYFTGNIGYHHVHHLNHRIPFYRLAEAMEAIPELRDPPGKTSLSPRDIRACFRLKLWDEGQEKMVGYPSA